MALLTDGYPTTLLFDLLVGGTIFREVSVTPPELTGNGFIDTTSMRNGLMRTKAPKSLLDFGPVTAEVQYDPVMYRAVFATINVVQRCTVAFPDGSLLTLWCFITRFAPSPHREGENPRATLEMVVCNINPAGFEALPVALP